MIYDYYHYNDPKVGNKRRYAYGEKHEFIEQCGFIDADNQAQAQTVLNDNNRVWEANNILLDYTNEECWQEHKRREALQKTDKK